MTFVSRFPQLLTAIALSAGLATSAFAATDPETIKVLERPEVDALLAHPETVVVIDLRRPDELTNIGGFPVYLSIQVADLGEKLAWIPKDRTVVTVSNHAHRAQRGAALLVDAGFEVAGSVGVQDYEVQGGTLSKIQPPAPKAQ